MLWLYYSAIALLLGAELDAELERRATASTARNDPLKRGVASERYA